MNEVLEVSPESKILLLGNKLDERSAVSIDEIGDLCHKLGCLEARVSCKTGQNIRETWRIISDTLINSYVDGNHPSTITLESSERDEEDNRCPC